jgi:HSP20 family molecular chaperone IbpA
MLTKKLSLLVLPLAVTLSLQANDPFFSDPFGDDIFKEMMQMQQNMDKMFERMHNRMQQRTTRQIAPMGTYQIQQQSQFVDKGDHYEFSTTIPESKENQIDVNTQNGVMSITAKIIQKNETKTANGYSSSSSMQMYQQSMQLPQDADDATITMAYVNGKLVVSVKKKATNSTKSVVPQIKVKKEDNKSKETNTTIKKMKVGDSSSMS